MITDNEHDRSVEDVWRDILTEHGVSENQADDIVTLTFATPALTRDIPDIQDVPDIVKNSLASTEFETYLDDDKNPAQVEYELVDVLKDALRGKYSGPAALPDATLDQEPPKPKTPGGAGIAHPDRARAYQSAAAARAAESDLDDEDIEAIATVLEKVMAEHTLETADLYAALERIEEDSTE